MPFEAEFNALQGTRLLFPIKRLVFPQFWNEIKKMQIMLTFTIVLKVWPFIVMSLLGANIQNQVLIDSF